MHELTKKIINNGAFLSDAKIDSIIGEWLGKKASEISFVYTNNTHEDFSSVKRCLGLTPEEGRVTAQEDCMHEYEKTRGCKTDGMGNELFWYECKNCHKGFYAVSCGEAAPTPVQGKEWCKHIIWQM